MPWLLLLPCVLATVVTLHPYKLYLGVSLTFGMSVALAVLFLARGWWGVLISIPVCMATYSMWGHAYSGSIFVLEGLLLALLRNSRWGDQILKKGSIIVVDFVFWLVLGAPLYYFSHFYFVGLNHQDSFLIAQKSIVNGVINILIAYIVYMVVTIWRNKRLPVRQNISIQALAIVIVYTVIVLTTLFSVGNLSNKLSFITSNAIYNKFRESASLAVSASGLGDGPDQPVAGLAGQGVDEKIRVFFGKSANSQSASLSAEGDSYLKRLESTSIDAVSRTRISRQVLKLAREDGTSIKLWMPKQSTEKTLLKRYAQSYWEATFDQGGEKVIIVQSAKQNFDNLADFYGGALSTFNYNFAAGILISFLVAFSLQKEFLVVLGIRSLKSNPSTMSDEDRRLLLSPISEVGRLAKEVNERTDVIQRSKAKIEELNRIAQQQLSTAGEIQQCFLGSLRASSQYPDVCLYMRPAYNAGGDWYDAFNLDGKTFIVVADVCDKGVGAALFMSVFRSLIRYSAETLCSARSESEPLDEVIASVNNYMATEHEDATMFATVFFACISAERGRLEYVLAGHEEPVLLDPRGNKESFQVSGPAIGLFPFATYEMGAVPFESGSMLVGYTDGVIDARNVNGESYGYDRLLAFLRSLQADNKVTDAKSLLSDIMGEIDVHMSGADQFDDITIATTTL